MRVHTYCIPSNDGNSEKEHLYSQYTACLLLAVMEKSVCQNIPYVAIARTQNQWHSTGSGMQTDPGIKTGSR